MIGAALGTQTPLWPNRCDRCDPGRGRAGLVVALQLRGRRSRRTRRQRRAEMANALAAVERSEIGRVARCSNHKKTHTHLAGLREMVGSAEVVDSTATAIASAWPALMRARGTTRLNLNQVEKRSANVVARATRSNGRSTTLQSPVANPFPAAFARSTGTSVNSPWWFRRNAILSRAMRRISPRVSAAIRGRPPRRFFEYRRQRPDKPTRWHRSTVPGFTICSASRHWGHHLRSRTQRARSAQVRLERGHPRLSTST